MKRIKWTLAALAALAASSAQAAATFTFEIMDGPGEGLNDATPFTPEGGNSATTLGAARLAVLEEAGRVWGAQLTSPFNIVVQAKFDPLTCTSNSGTLGSANAATAYANFPNAPLADVVYPAALAKALAGTNPFPGEADISTTLNSSVGNAGCLDIAGPTRFYLGFDHNTGGNIDLLNTVLHEFAHGLGFAANVLEDGTSAYQSGRFSIYSQLMYSETLGLFWSQMSTPQRAASLISNDATLVWNGANSNAQSNLLTGGRSTGGHITLYAPTTYSAGSTASHWDIAGLWAPGGGASRSLLMEPFTSFNPLGLTDFTGCALADMGWTGTRCPDQTGVPLGPIAQAQTLAGTEDIPQQITLLGTSPNSASLTYSIITPPTRGALAAPASLVSSSGVVFTYTPTANLSGTDSFVFQVNDGTADPATATITINVAAVNDRPVANAQTLNVTAGDSLAITLSGSDVEGTTLVYALATNPTKGTLTGTVPNLTYTANKNSTGVDTFTFNVNDGGLFSTNATVTINIAAAPGGGGGSMDWLVLLLLVALLAGTHWRLRLQRIRT